MSDMDMQAELERLRAENAQLKHKDRGGLTLKVSEQIIERLGLGDDRGVVHDWLDWGVGPVVHEPPRERRSMDEPANAVAVLAFDHDESRVAA